MGRITGTVKWFNNTKGFGFISGPGGEDHFVHHTSIEAEGYRTLEEGETVEFEVEPGPKGLKAIRVKRLSPNMATLASNSTSKAVVNE